MRAVINTVQRSVRDLRVDDRGGRPGQHGASGSAGTHIEAFLWTTFDGLPVFKRPVSCEHCRHANGTTPAHLAHGWKTLARRPKSVLDFVHQARGERNVQKGGRSGHGG